MVYLADKCCGATMKLRLPFVFLFLKAYSNIMHVSLNRKVNERVMSVILYLCQMDHCKIKMIVFLQLILHQIISSNEAVVENRVDNNGVDIKDSPSAPLQRVALQRVSLQRVVLQRVALQRVAIQRVDLQRAALQSAGSDGRLKGYFFQKLFSI